METKEKKTTVSARVSVTLKRRATQVAESMGMDMSTAINMFLVKMVNENALPFTPTGSLEKEADAMIEEYRGAMDYLKDK